MLSLLADLFLRVLFLQMKKSTHHLMTHDVLLCLAAFFSSYDWYISIPIVLTGCFLKSLILCGSPVAVFLDRGHPRLWNFYPRSNHFRKKFQKHGWPRSRNTIAGGPEYWILEEEQKPFSTRPHYAGKVRFSHFTS